VFKRAIERGNLLIAEMTARELGRLALADALDLLVLVVEKEPERRDRFATRWLSRLIEEDPRLTLDEVRLAASALAALGGRSHEQSASLLAQLARRCGSSRGMVTPLNLETHKAAGADRVRDALPDREGLRRPDLGPAFAALVAAAPGATRDPTDACQRSRSRRTGAPGHAHADAGLPFDGLPASLDPCPPTG
jgi:hypothetical protein